MQEKIKNFIACFIFLILIVIVFVNCTYLFRNTDRFARQNVLGLYHEKKNSLDVIFIGSSHVYRYWSPMEAWNLYGISSYDYSVSAMSSVGVKSAISDVERFQNPRLFVVDVRAFLNRGEPKEIEAAERNILDSLDLNLTRLQAVNYAVDIMDLNWEEAMTEYFDLAQYHNNTEALASELNWQMMDNRLNSSIDQDGGYKGFAIAAKHAYQEFIDNGLNDEIMSYEKVPATYFDLMEYCYKKEIPLLLISAPYNISYEDSMEVNAMSEIAENYGFKFLDCNKYYGEIGINFATDYYDTSHVNILGAKKYTKFVGKYILDNYKYEEAEAVNEVYKILKDN